MTLANKSAVKMTSGEPDFQTPQHIKDAAKKALDDGYTYYTSAFGLPEFRDAVAQTLNEEGYAIKSRNILVSPGAIEAIFSVLFGFLNPEDECIIPNPGYSSYNTQISLAGAKSVGIELGGSNFKLDPTDLEKAITPRTRIVILNSPSNPTGAMIDFRDLKEIVEICKEHDLLLLSDEAYDKIVFDGRKQTSVLEFSDIYENLVAIKSLSKTYAMTGWRLGYLVGSSEMVKELSKIQTYILLSVSATSQKAGVAALRGPQNFVAEMVREFEERRNLIVRELSRIAGIDCPKPEGAFYVFPSFSGFPITSSFEMARYLLSEGGIGVYPGVGFGTRGEGRIRLSFATSRETIQEALRRLESSLHHLNLAAK